MRFSRGSSKARSIVCLKKERFMERIGKDDYYLNIALEVSQRGTCLRLYSLFAPDRQFAIASPPKPGEREAVGELAMQSYDCEDFDSSSSMRLLIPSRSLLMASASFLSI